MPLGNHSNSSSTLSSRIFMRGLVEKIEATISRPPSRAFERLRGGMSGLVGGLIKPTRLLTQASSADEGGSSRGGGKGTEKEKDEHHHHLLTRKLAALAKGKERATAGSSRNVSRKTSTSFRVIPIPDSPPLKGPVPLLRLRWNRRKLTISLPLLGPIISEINVYHNLYPEQDMREQISTIEICFKPIPKSPPGQIFIDPETGKFIGKTTVGLELEDIDDSWFLPTLPREMRRNFEEVWEETYGSAGESSSSEDDDIFYDAEEEIVSGEPTIDGVLTGDLACLGCRPPLTHHQASTGSNATQTSLTEKFPELRPASPFPKTEPSKDSFAGAPRASTQPCRIPMKLARHIQPRTSSLPVNPGRTILRPASPKSGKKVLRDIVSSPRKDVFCEDCRDDSEACKAGYKNNVPNVTNSMATFLTTLNNDAPSLESSEMKPLVDPGSVEVLPAQAYRMSSGKPRPNLTIEVPKFDASAYSNPSTHSSDDALDFSSFGNFPRIPTAIKPPLHRPQPTRVPLTRLISTPSPTTMQHTAFNHINFNNVTPSKDTNPTQEEIYSSTSASTKSSNWSVISTSSAPQAPLSHRLERLPGYGFLARPDGIHLEFFSAVDRKVKDEIQGALRAEAFREELVSGRKDVEAVEPVYVHLRKHLFRTDDWEIRENRAIGDGVWEIDVPIIRKEEWV